MGWQPEADHVNHEPEKSNRRHEIIYTKVTTDRTVKRSQSEEIQAVKRFGERPASAQTVRSRWPPVEPDWESPVKEAKV